MLTEPHRLYRQNQVALAAPGKLLLMLYNGALTNLKMARAGIEGKNLEQANSRLVKAQDIVYELMLSLDLERGEEIAAGLQALYGYIGRRLAEANAKKDTVIIKEAEDMLSELRDSWSAALAKI